MIVIDKPKLKFLLNGRAIQVDVTREYKRGRSYAVGTSHRRSVCRALVVDRFELSEGVWRLTIKQHAEEQVRWLARQGVQGDYTTQIENAVPDHEALSKEDLERFANGAWQRREAERRLELRRQRVRSLAIRLKDAERRHDADGIAAIRAELEALERQMRDAA